MEDLTINGPGSPISLKKFLDIQKPDKPFSLLVDGTHLGIAKDSKDVIYITADDCKEQAIHYLCNIWDKDKRVPGYLIRHLLYMYGFQKDFEDYKYKYASIKEAVDAIGNDTENEEYKACYNILEYGKHSSETMQIVGIIQLLAGTMRMGKGKGYRVYLEHPETHLHPAKQSRFMSMFLELRKEFE